MSYGYGWEKRGVSYDTLYGHKWTEAEFEAEMAERKKRGQFIADAYYVPEHCLWHHKPNGGTDMNGEWSFSGAYTCEKIIRPSYDEQMAVVLVVQIGSKRLGWTTKYRYNRWSASLRCGRYSSYFAQKYAHSCNSLVDACRKAEKLPFIDDEVKKLLKRVFSPIGSSALFRYDTDACEFLPYKTDLGAAGSPSDWPTGKYYSVDWHRPYKGPDKTQWLLKGSSTNVTGGGYSGGGTDVPGVPYQHTWGKNWQMVQQAMIEAVGCWLPKPEEGTWA